METLLGHGARPSGSGDPRTCGANRVVVEVVRSPDVSCLVDVDRGEVLERAVGAIAPNPSRIAGLRKTPSRFVEDLPEPEHGESIL